MQYRKFGDEEWKPSALGFGAMRLPLLRDSKEIDEELAIKMIRYAIDHGVNYIDTAYPYHGGKSEVVIGKALQDGYREKVRLTTKSPVWLVKNWDDFDKYLDEQLERLQTDYIDYYFFHALRRSWWEKLLDIDALGWAENAITEGRFGGLGFSFHADTELFREIIDAYDNWAIAQIQLNYLDTDYQAGLEGLRYAAEKGVPVSIMEPIKGGFLAMKPPNAVAEIWARAENQRSQAEWALQWVWNRPEVGIVLSGMSEMQHVVENVEYACRSAVGSLSGNELDLVDEVVAAYRSMGFIGCTDCRYCMPCPQGVYISKIMRLMNEYYMSGKMQKIKQKAWGELRPEWEATNCITCGQCEEKCPQELKIMRIMGEAKWVLARPDD